MNKLFLSVFFVMGMLVNVVFLHAEKAAIAPKELSPEEQIEQKKLPGWIIESAAVAKKYVEDLDKGLYSQSWVEGDKLFQSTIDEKDWTLALEGSRKLLGKVQSRNLKDQRIAWNPKGLPPGAYMVVIYNTAFEKSPAATELVTLRLGSDNKWRVLTYQVGG